MASAYPFEHLDKIENLVKKGKLTIPQALATIESKAAALLKAAAQPSLLGFQTSSFSISEKSTNKNGQTQYNNINLSSHGNFVSFPVESESAESLSSKEEIADSPKHSNTATNEGTGRQIPSDGYPDSNGLRPDNVSGIPERLRASRAVLKNTSTKHALTRDAARRSNLIPKDTNGQELPASRAAWLLLQHATKKTIADTISGKLSITQALSTIESKAAAILKAAAQPSIPGFQTSSFSISEKSTNNTGQTQYNNINSSSHGNFVSFPVESESAESLSSKEAIADSPKHSNTATNEGTGRQIPSDGYTDSNVLLSDNAARLDERMRARRAVLKNTSSIHRPAEHVVASYKKEGFYTGDLHELKPGIESATLFQELINKAKETQGILGDCVYTYDVEDYAKMRLFLSPDGMAGVALKEDGDMVSVFKNKNLRDNGEKRISSLISLAISNGAKKADCYGSVLVNLYGKFGFRAVAKDQFNPEYASEAMQNSELMDKVFSPDNGKPDVVYLVFEGDSQNPFASYNPGYKADYKTELTYTDYDTCVEIQTKEVERRFQNQTSSFSVNSKQAQSAFNKDGILEAANAIVTKPTASFSVSALHVSPHNFRKFSTDFMGSGEGTQAFGWGLYFATNYGVNKSYFKLFNRTIEERTPEFEAFYKELKETGYNWDNSLDPEDNEHLVGFIESFIYKALKLKEATQESLQAWQKHDPRMFEELRNDIKKELAKRPKGKIARFFFNYNKINEAIDKYKKQLRHFRIYSLGDSEREIKEKWNQRQKEKSEKIKNLSQQLDELNNKLNKLHELKEKAESLVLYSISGEKAINYRVELNVDDSNLLMWDDYISEDFLESLIKNTPYMPDSLKKELRDGKLKGKALYYYLSHWLQGDKEASKFLLTHGIKGIKFLDRVSRRRGEGTYNYVIFDGKDIKITAVNETGVWDMNNGWQPYTDPTASFSLTTSRRKYMPLSEAVKLEEYIAMEDYARRLYRDAIALAQANPKNKLDDAVRAAMHLRALLNAVFSRLPKDAQPWKALGHARKQIDSLTWAVSHSYADLDPHQAPGISPAEIEKYNESGYRDRRQWLTNKLSRLIVSVADSAARSIEAHACRTLLATAEAAVKTLLPKTQKSGKERRGITSADVYTKAIDFYKMFDWGTAERTKELTEISDTLNDPDITDQQRIEAEKRRQAILCFAGLNKESLPRVKAGVELLLAYIRTGRLKWEEKLLEERRATEAIQEAIATLEPKIEHSKTTAKEDKKRGGFANLFTSLLNPIQTLNIFATLPGKVGEIYTNLRAQLATAEDNKTYAIQQAHQDAAHALDAILGIENKNSLTRQIERADFLTRMNRRKNTGIFKQGRVKITTFQFTQQDILDLQQIRQEQGQQAFITAIDKHRRKYDKEDALTQNIPYEEVFQDALSQLKSPDYRGGTIFVEHTGPRDTAHQEELILTPLQAANLWLLAQQPSYSNKYDQDGNLIERGMLDTLGYTDHVIAQLETFIGPQLRAYALWKREYLNTTGLFEAYEQHMGLPFPKEENYWPGAFDTVANNSGLDALQTAYAGNGVYNMLILRKKHLSEPNLSVDIEAAWEHAISQHYHYIHLSPITRQLRAITRDADTRQRLRKIAGNAALDNVQTMLNTLDGAPALQLQAAAHANNLFMRWFTPFAKALLNMATGTTVKQTSAIGHALAYNGINWLNIAPKLLTTTLSGLTHIKRDPGHKTPQEILKLKSFRVRINREDLGLIASRLSPGETQSKLAIIDLLGSRFLEYADAGANSIAMAAVYNTEYDTAKKIMLAANNGSPLTPEQQQQLADHCENTVSVLLKQAAQPLEKEDKPIIQQQKNFALSQNYFMMGEILSKVACFASIIKAGHAAAYGKPLPEARRIITHAWAKGLSFYSGMGIASQSILALLSYFIGSAPDAEDEDFSAWILSNILAGAIGFSYLNALPFIGEALSTAAQSIYGTHGVFATYATTGIGITYKDLKDLFKLLDPDKPTAERVYSGSNLLRITTTMLGFFCSGIKGANTVYELFSAANNINNLIRPGLQRAKNSARKEQKQLKALTRQQKSTRQPRYTSKRYTPPTTP